MTIKRLTAAVVAVAGLGIGGTALAQTPQDLGFYVGGSLGYSTGDIDTGKLTGTGMTTTSTDDNDTGWKLFAGYQFHRNFAIEGTYYDLGKFSASGVLTGTATPASASVKVKGWGLAGVGIIPLQQNFSLFGKFGGFWADASASAPNATILATLDDHSSDWVAGFGLMYNFSRNVGVRAEAEWIGSDTALYSIGVQFKF